MNPQDYIPKPCYEDWTKMTGTEQKKFCSSCSCHVHDLTDLNREEILALKTQLGGKLCGSFRTATQQQPATHPFTNSLTTPFTRPFALGVGIASLALASCDKDQKQAKQPDVQPDKEVVTDPVKRPVQLDPVKGDIVIGVIACPEPAPKLQPSLPPKQRLLGKVRALDPKLNAPNSEKNPAIKGKIHRPNIKQVEPKKISPIEPMMLGEIVVPPVQPDPNEDKPKNLKNIS